MRLKTGPASHPSTPSTLCALIAQCLWLLPQLDLRYDINARYAAVTLLGAEAAA